MLLQAIWRIESPRPTLRVKPDAHLGPLHQDFKNNKTPVTDKLPAIAEPKFPIPTLATHLQHEPQTLQHLRAGRARLPIWSQLRLNGQAGGEELLAAGAHLKGGQQAPEGKQESQVMDLGAIGCWFLYYGVYCWRRQLHQRPILQSLLPSLKNEHPEKIPPIHWPLLLQEHVWKCQQVPWEAWSKRWSEQGIQGHGVWKGHQKYRKQLEFERLQRDGERHIGLYSEGQFWQEATDS